MVTGCQIAGLVLACPNMEYVHVVEVPGTLHGRRSEGIVVHEEVARGYMYLVLAVEVPGEGRVLWFHLPCSYIEGVEDMCMQGRFPGIVVVSSCLWLYLHCLDVHEEV